MSRRPNYLPAVSVLADQLRRHGRPGTITHVAVEHEPGCAFWIGGECDCSPDVRVLRTEPVRGDDEG